MSIRELSDTIMAHAQQSRPDVQPDVIEALRYSSWRIAEYLHGVHPSNILRYDGGEGERSGQLSWDLEIGDRVVRVTSELDLLHATESPSELAEVDWKTGNETWTTGKVARSFQFQCHAWLVLRNYPDVETVNIIVWNTRRGGRTSPVPFQRERLLDWETRMKTAAMNLVVGNEAAWPTREKCRLCPVARECVQTPRWTRMVAESPEARVDALYVAETAVEAMRRDLEAVVDRTGKDIVGAQSGMRFGRCKPTTPRQPKATLYEP